MMNKLRYILGSLVKYSSSSVIKVHDLFVVKFLTSVSHSLLDSLLGCLQEFLLLELQLLLYLLSLNVGDEE
jgi:hypothetical protein